MFFLSPFLRFFFHLLYHQFVWTYDWVAALVSVGQWKDWVQTVLPYLEGPVVLELGHGPGHLQSRLLESGANAIGVDASPQMGRLAKRRLNRAGQPAQIIQARSQFLPVASGTCDQIVSTFPTEYIHDPNTLKEAWRVLKAGGCLVVLPAAWITGQRWMERYAAALFRITKQTPSLQQTPGFPQAPNLPQASSLAPGARSIGPTELRQISHFPLVDLLEETGFQVSVEWKELRSSTLIVILAEKPGS